MLKTEFYFIRHGETDWNRDHRTMGQKDIPLNNTGRLQARQATHLLKTCDIKTICHSPLYRAKETAEILNESLKCPLIEIDFLKECGWGVLEGELKDNRQYLEQWINGITPEGAETCEAFKERAIKGFQSALLHPNPLIVSHGGIYWALQNMLCKNSLHSSAQNCLPFHFLLSESNKYEWTCVSLEPTFDEEFFES